MRPYDVKEIRALCIAAALKVGAGPIVAQALANATVAAELRGRPAVGLIHFFDFLQGLDTGAINGTAVPELTHEGSMVWVDAHGGIPHTGLLEAERLLVGIARSQGCAVFMQKNSYTCGELGYFTDHFAEQGLLAFAFANSPALLAAGGKMLPVFGTNPMSMAAPLDHGPALLIDQAASNTAYVSIREAADEGGSIPEGWAVDSAGSPTTDPQAAMGGALLPFGEYRGANLAIMAEVLAGLAGGNWSLDAPSFLDGRRSPGIGMFVLVVDPGSRDRSFPRRLRLHLERLERNYGVRIPGRRGTRKQPTGSQVIDIPDGLYRRLLAAA